MCCKLRSLNFDRIPLENQLVKAKYDYDAKYARIHKRLIEKDPLIDSERKLFEDLKGLKSAVTTEIQQNANSLENESYVEKMMMRLVVSQFKKEQKIDINTTDVRRINSSIVKEYRNEYNGYVA
ncbi:hypothetical protein ACIGCP_16915 [Cellulophaga baltica]|uniref:hypothetical protein n=1 Tax=Cellulophaga baltica TaxID=76594 RepID=UPI0037C80BE2